MIGNDTEKAYFRKNQRVVDANATENRYLPENLPISTDKCNITLLRYVGFSISPTFAEISSLCFVAGNKSTLLHYTKPQCPFSLALALLQTGLVGLLVTGHHPLDGEPLLHPAEIGRAHV